MNDNPHFLIGPVTVFQLITLIAQIMKQTKDKLKIKSLVGRCETV